MQGMQPAARREGALTMWDCRLSRSSPRSRHAEVMHALSFSHNARSWLWAGDASCTERWGETTSSLWSLLLSHTWGMTSSLTARVNQNRFGLKSCKYGERRVCPALKQDAFDMADGNPVRVNCSVFKLEDITAPPEAVKNVHHLPLANLTRKTNIYSLCDLKLFSCHHKVCKSYLFPYSTEVLNHSPETNHSQADKKLENEVFNYFHVSSKRLIPWDQAGIYQLSLLFLCISVIRLCRSNQLFHPRFT